MNRAQFTWLTLETTEFKSSAQRESSKGDSDGGVKGKESLRYSMCHSHSMCHSNLGDL